MHTAIQVSERSPLLSSPLPRMHTHTLITLQRFHLPPSLPPSQLALSAERVTPSSVLAGVHDAYAAVTVLKRNTRSHAVQRAKRVQRKERVRPSVNTLKEGGRDGEWKAGTEQRADERSSARSSSERMNRAEDSSSSSSSSSSHGDGIYNVMNGRGGWNHGMGGEGDSKGGDEDGLGNVVAVHVVKADKAVKTVKAVKAVKTVKTVKRVNAVNAVNAVAAAAPAGGMVLDIIDDFYGDNR